MRKRDETNSLIEEVFAQKKALEEKNFCVRGRIKCFIATSRYALFGFGIRNVQIDEKLEIAKERLQAIEQEEYLEELGNSLNRSHLENSDPTGEVGSSSEESEISVIDDLELPSPAPSSMHSSISSPMAKSLPSHLSQSTASTGTPVMKSTTNRIQEQNIEADKSESPKQTMSAITSPTALSLDETAQKLGVEPEFLADKGINAILRMIARNGGKLSFPLEVEQIS